MNLEKHLRKSGGESPKKINKSLIVQFAWISVHVSLFVYSKSLSFHSVLIAQSPVTQSLLEQELKKKKTAALQNLSFS